MTWHYGLVLEDNYWTVREIYVDEEGGLSWSVQHVRPSGENLTEFFADFDRMAEDIRKHHYFVNEKVELRNFDDE